MTNTTNFVSVMKGNKPIWLNLNGVAYIEDTNTENYYRIHFNTTQFIEVSDSFLELNRILYPKRTN